jgi:nondiscriminating aspartyl-tRNA synthetase
MIMKRTMAAELAACNEGQEAPQQSWVHRTPRLPHIDFLLLRDRTGLVQMVMTEPETRAQLQLPAAGTTGRPSSGAGWRTENVAAVGGRCVDMVVVVVLPLLHCCTTALAAAAAVWSWLVVGAATQ